MDKWTFYEEVILYSIATRGSKLHTYITIGEKYATVVSTCILQSNKHAIRMRYYTAFCYYIIMHDHDKYYLHSNTHNICGVCSTTLIIVMTVEHCCIPFMIIEQGHFTYRFFASYCTILSV